MTTQHDERAEFIRELEIIASTQWSGFFPGSAAERMKGIVQQAAALLAADAQAGGEAAVYFCDYGHEGWGKIDASAVEQHRSWGMTVEKYYIHHQPQAVDAEWLERREQAAYEAGKQAVAQWQPIETAPKDGTAILVTDSFAYRSDPKKTLHHIYRAVYWDDESGWVIYNDGEIIDEDGPTYWMPLPAEPGATLSASPAAPAAAQVADWRDGVNVARLRAALTRMGIATEPSEEGMAADLENWVNTLTRAVTAGKPAAQVAQPLTQEELDETLRAIESSKKHMLKMNEHSGTGIMGVIRYEAIDNLDSAASKIKAAYGIGKDQG